MLIPIARKFCVLWFALLVVTSPSSTRAETRMVLIDETKASEGSAVLSAAIKELASTGGVIVLRGELRVEHGFKAPSHAEPITLTGLHEGKDRGTADRAALILEGDYTVGGPTRFAHLQIGTVAQESHIFCEGFTLHFQAGLSSHSASGARFPTIVGAAKRNGHNAGSDLTIESGDWHSVIGGSLTGDEATRGQLRTVIRGGSFKSLISAVGPKRHVGDVTLTLVGGHFFGGVTVLANAPDASVDGEVTVTLEGGRYYNRISASRHEKSHFTGSYHLTIRGGDFRSVTDVTGTSGMSGAVRSTLSVSKQVFGQRPTDVMTFSNPLIEGADPWILFHDGFYYSTSTGNSQLVGRKFANLSDLPHADSAVLYKPEAGKPYSRHLWSPKFYHLDDQVAGPGNGGFYLYFTANDGRGRPALDHRLFVLKSLTGDPLGPYGSPQDGSKNIPIRVTSTGKNQFSDEWVAGPKVLKYRDKHYLIWVGRFGGPESEKVGDHWQCLYIDELINPWTVAGRAALICSPTLPWEKHGAGMTGTGDQRRMLPEVIEGGTPVITEDGTLYLLYASSGYWTPHYAIGKLKLIGDDPLNPAHWQKSPEPIFKASDEVVGSANACYVPSPAGKSHWAVYHAYVGRKTQGVPRHLFAERYLADRDGFSIGRGTPAPLRTVHTVEANPLSLREKAHRFTEVIDGN